MGSKRCKRDRCKANKRLSLKEQGCASPGAVTQKEVTTDDIYQLLQKLHNYDKEQIANHALIQVCKATTGSNTTTEDRPRESGEIVL